jgi:hypothetical protein
MKGIEGDSGGTQEALPGQIFDEYVFTYIIIFALATSFLSFLLG